MEKSRLIVDHVFTNFTFTPSQTVFPVFAIRVLLIREMDVATSNASQFKLFLDKISRLRTIAQISVGAFESHQSAAVRKARLYGM